MAQPPMNIISSSSIISSRPTVIVTNTSHPPISSSNVSHAYSAVVKKPRHTHSASVNNNARHTYFTAENNNARRTLSADCNNVRNNYTIFNNNTNHSPSTDYHNVSNTHNTVDKTSLFHLPAANSTYRHAHNRVNNDHDNVVNKTPFQYQYAISGAINAYYSAKKYATSVHHLPSTKV